MLQSMYSQSQMQFSNSTSTGLARDPSFSQTKCRRSKNQRRYTQILLVQGSLHRATQKSLGLSTFTNHNIIRKIQKISLGRPKLPHSISHHNGFVSLPAQVITKKLRKKKRKPKPNTKFRRYTFLQTTTMHTGLEILPLIPGINFHN